MGGGGRIRSVRIRGRIAAYVLLLAFVMQAPARGAEGSGEKTGPEKSGGQAPRALAEPPSAFRFPEVNVTAARGERTPIDLPYSISPLVLGEETGLRFRTLPEAVDALPGVMTQKTSHGQGSPYIRGLTSFHTLLLIDGVRLNNSVFRSGPNQYWNTVDPFSLERVELVRGPASVLYGSDAVGGTVNAVTLSPGIPDRGWTIDPRLDDRFASAEASHQGRAEIGVGGMGRFGLLGGISCKDFGDLVGGRHVGRMEKTGYREWDGDLKAVWKPSDAVTVSALIQHVSIENAWRTHKTVYGISWHGTTVGNERERILDQQRDLGYAQAEWTGKAGWFRRAQVSVSYQVQQEDRNRTKSAGKSDWQGFDAGTAGAFALAELETPAGRITAGLEHYHDVVNSFARKYDADGSLSSVEIQGPVGDDAAYDLFGAFLRDELRLGDFLEITGGLRFTWASALAQEVKDPRTGDPIEVSDRWSDLSGSLRFLVKPADGLRVYGGAAQGFRAPNLSDLTRLDTARSDEIETPSPDLDAEHFLTFELGVKADRRPFSAQIALFYTLLMNGIMRYPTGRMIGSDHEVTKDNVGDGFAYGLEAEGALRIGGGFSVRGSFFWMEGMQDTYDDERRKVRTWLSRLPPMEGSLGLRYEDPKGRFWVEGSLEMAGRADKLSLRDEGDTQRIPPGGTPGYGLLSLRLGAKPAENVSLFAGAENLGNKDYRVHGSGLNGPGTNLLLGLELGLP